MIYIFDIDSTLANNQHRVSFITGDVKDWEAFHKGMADDKPIWEVITVARALSSAGHGIVYSTGRMEKGRGVTIAWLNKYRAPLGPIYMRADGDHREDTVVKSELLGKIVKQFKAEIGGVFEDRQQCVDMYRARGMRVFQVEKGDY
jgi:hypothetical protein